MTCYRCGFAGRNLAPAISSGEPTFGAGQTKIFDDDMSAYGTSFASAVSIGGWRGTNGDTTLDTTTNALGAQRIFTSGGPFGGSYLRLVYDGIANAGGQEAHSWSKVIDGLAGNLAAKAGHALYLTHYYRVLPANFVDDGTCSETAVHYVQLKWKELWRSVASGIGDRAQFSTSNSFSTNGLPHTLWNAFASASYLPFPSGYPPHTAGSNYSMGGQCIPPYMCTAAGSWHRLTYKYVTKSAPGARDGVMQLWHDGVKVVDVSAATAGVPVPGAQGVSSDSGGKQHWCEDFHLDDFIADDPVSRITIGSVNAGVLQAMTIDETLYSCWRD